MLTGVVNQITALPNDTEAVAIKTHSRQLVPLVRKALIQQDNQDPKFESTFAELKQVVNEMKLCESRRKKQGEQVLDFLEAARIRVQQAVSQLVSSAK